MNQLLCLPACIALVFAAPTQAQNLVDLYDLARGFDATYQSAKAQFDANLARAEQARAGLLPTAALTAGASLSRVEGTNPSIGRTNNAQNLGLSGSQPLYRPANRASAEQGLRQAQLAEQALNAAGQDLIIRVSQAYFDVLGAQDSLLFVKAQKTAVAEQLASAKRNFEVGTSTITDAREAQARFDLVVAQEIAADNDLRVKRLALDTLVGKPDTEPKSLNQPATAVPVVPPEVGAWLAQAEEASPSIRSARLNLEVAKLETDKAKAGQLPTVDAVASLGVSRSPSALIANSHSRTNSASIGVNLNWPLFTGYAVQNRIKETLSLEEKALADLEAARRAVAQATRAAFFGVVSGSGQVKALEASEQSSQLALDANKLGYQVGVRINIDVLNSQSQLFQTKRDLAQARYNVLLGSLRLRQANGTLTAEDLKPINALLGK
jgi:outer membrane protein